MRLIVNALVLLVSSLIGFAQPIVGPLIATSNSVPTFIDNKHLRNNTNLLFDGTNLMLNGNSFITNAAAGITFSVNGTSSTAPNLTNTSTLAIFLNSDNVTFWPTNLANAQIASGAAIDESKIANLVSDLAAKQTGSQNLTNWSALTTNALINSSSGFGTNTTLVTPTLSGATLSGSTTNSAATASRFATFDANKVLSTSGASADLAATLTDESGTGAAVFGTTPTISGATLSGNTTNSSLTASRPMKTDANKVQVSGQIDLSTANEVTGVLLAAGFPALTGDITTVAGALATTLKNTGTAGTYAGITFDAQGRETSTTAFPVTMFLGSLQNRALTTTGVAVPLMGSGTGTPLSWTAANERSSATPFIRSGTFSNFVVRILDNSTGNATGSGTNTTFILYTNAVASGFAFTLTTDGSQTTTN